MVDSQQTAQILAEIRALKTEKNALILAHNYQVPEVQDVADFVGDSLGLSIKARDSPSNLIVFCGVLFMAETAKILRPDATVLSPEPDAGCSLVDSITLDEVRVWKAEHPHAVAVGYVNSTAEIKAELDYCCTSGNAARVVQAIDPDKEILFLPDMFLGNYVKQVTGRKNMRIWAGECHVHAGISLRTIQQRQKENPGATMLVHPECGCSTTCMYHAAMGDVDGETVITSTSGMIDYSRDHPEQGSFIVATEVGILYPLQKALPDKRFIAVSEEAICQYMKMITPEKLLHSLREEVTPVELEENVLRAARTSIDRMVAIA